MNSFREVFGEEVGAGGVAPAPVEGRAEKDDVEPVDEKRGAVVDESSEQRRGERGERDGAEEGDVNPGEIAVGAGELVELRLLTDPEDTVGHYTHQKNDKTRRKGDEGAPEIVLGVNGFGGGDTEIEREQRHGHGENAVAESGEAFDALSGNTVVEGVHRKEFSGLSGSGQRTLDGARGRVVKMVRRGLGGILLLAGSLAITGGGALAQDGASPQPAPQQGSQQDQSPKNENPQNEKPAEVKKDEGSNPAQAAGDAAKKLGEETLVKARDWENGWFTGAYVGKNRKLVTLTTQQREEIYLQQTLTTPSAYFKRMIAAGIDQARGSPPQWGGGWGGYGKRFASREGQFIAANSLAALGNAKLHYEPRYDQCRCSGFGPRTRHAILRNFLTYNQSERELRPQWALYGGALGGGLISTAWKPHPRNAFAEGGRAMGEQAGYGAVLNFFIEFAGDINRKLGMRRKP
jgi:hypothetical protein